MFTRPNVYASMIAIMLLSIFYVCSLNASERKTGFATYYTAASCQSEGTSGVWTASRERFDENDLTCAMRSRDWGSLWTVTRAGKSVIVRLNDYGPGRLAASRGVVVDLTPTAWTALGVSKSIGRVAVTVERYRPDNPAKRPTNEYVWHESPQRVDLTMPF